jgi:hypothetical protein
MWASIILRLLWVSFCIKRRSIDDAFSGPNLGILQYRALPLLLGECNQRNFAVQSLLLCFRKARRGSHLCLGFPGSSASRWHKRIEVVAPCEFSSNSTVRATKIALSQVGPPSRRPCVLIKYDNGVCMYDYTSQHVQACNFTASGFTGKERDAELNRTDNKGECFRESEQSEDSEQNTRAQDGRSDGNRVTGRS